MTHPAAAQVAVEGARVTASGDLSSATAAGTLTALEAAFAAHPAANELDLSAVKQCDSAGLACIIELAAMLDQRQRALRLSHMPAPMQALAAVSDLPRLFRSQT